MDARVNIASWFFYFFFEKNNFLETTMQIGLVCDTAGMFIRWFYPKCVLSRSKYQDVKFYPKP
jgi:hypothetical protein